MSIITEIYNELQLDTEQTEMRRMQDACLHSIARTIEGGDEKEDEFIKDLFFQASASGQEYGFWSGFRFAVKLMAECFVSV